jgi:hypothetical protein
LQKYLFVSFLVVPLYRNQTQNKTKRKMETTKKVIAKFTSGGVKLKVGQKVVINLYYQRLGGGDNRLSKVNENSFVYIASQAKGYGSRGTVYVSLNKDLSNQMQVEVKDIATDWQNYVVYVAFCNDEVLDQKLISQDATEWFLQKVAEDHELEYSDLLIMPIAAYEIYKAQLSKEEVTPAVEVAKVETTQAPAVSKSILPNPIILSSDKSFASSDDCLADGIKAIMQQPTKVVHKETIALRLLHFFNAHAKQYNCDPIVSFQGEKLFIDAYLQGGSVAFLSGLSHYISDNLLLAMQAFSEQEFENPIYFSENKTEFAQGELVIDKYGFLFGYGDPIIDKIKKSPYNYTPKDLRLSCKYEQFCLDIESAIELLIDYNDNSFGCESFKNKQFGTDYQDFWVYKLQGLAGEDKEYIIRKIADLDKEFAKFLCQKVLPKIADYKELYDFLELTF